jgi:hypothetical protein
MIVGGWKRGAEVLRRVPLGRSFTSDDGQDVDSLVPGGGKTPTTLRSADFEFPSHLLNSQGRTAKPVSSVLNPDPTPQSFEDDAGHSRDDSERNEAEQKVLWDIFHMSGASKQGAASKTKSR